MTVSSKLGFIRLLVVIAAMATVVAIWRPAGADHTPAVHLIHVPDDISAVATSEFGANVAFDDAYSLKFPVLMQHLVFSFGPGTHNPYNEYLEYRRAIAHAIDREALVATVNGAGAPLYSYVDPWAPELSQAAWNVYDYSPTTAVQYLNDLCDIPEVDCVANPPTVTIATATTIYTDRPAAATQILTMLEAVGFTVNTVDVQTSGTLFGTTLPTSDFDIAMYGYTTSGDAGPPVVYEQGLDHLVGAIEANWDPTVSAPAGNYGQYGGAGSLVSDEHTDRLVELIGLFTGASVAELEGYVAEFEQILADQVVFIPLYATRDDPEQAVTCDHDSGDLFPVGTTVVECSAVYLDGSSAEGSFSITVEFLPAPTVGGVPDDIVVDAEGPSGAQVDYVEPGAIQHPMQWEHILFGFDPGSLTANPESYVTHIEFRKAVAHAINRDLLVAEIEDAGLALDTHVAAWDPTIALGAWAQYDYNPALAEDYLDDLCDKPGVDCIANQPTLRMVTNTGVPARAEFMSLMEVMLADVGIVFVDDSESSGSFFGTTLPDGTFESALFAWSPIAPSRETLVTFYGEIFDPGNPAPVSQNYGRYGSAGSLLLDTHSARLEELIDLMDGASGATLVGHLQEYEQILADQLVMIPLWARAEAGATVECDPASGSVFPIGDTVVTCTASRGFGPTTIVTFTVTVEAEPIEVEVDSPVAGPVTVITTPVGPGDHPEGFQLVGFKMDVTAPASTFDDPITLLFSIDTSVLPVGTGIDDIVVFRDGVAVPPCTHGSHAVPDPCVASRTVVGDRFEILVRTSEASLWTMGLPTAVDRYAGANRFATAVEISKNDFPDPGTVSMVLVAVGNNFPDALAGAAAGGKLGAPMLLVNTGSIPDVTAAELTRLDPDTIVVLGGTAVISPGVAADLGAWGTVERWAGANRYATAAKISSETFDDPSEVDEVIIATGANFPDALGGGPVAAAVGGPVLLVPPTGVLPTEIAAELTRLSPTRITVLGGESAVSGGMFTQLQGYAATVERKSGSNRYATAIEASKHGFGSSVRVYVAVGTNFPDALAGAAAAGFYDAPVLLVPSGSLPPEVAAEITRLGATKVIILGGTGVVSLAVENALKALLGI